MTENDSPLASFAEKGKVERRRGYLWGTDSPAL